MDHRLQQLLSNFKSRIRKNPTEVISLHMHVLWHERASPSEVSEAFLEKNSTYGGPSSTKILYQFKPAEAQPIPELDYQLLSMKILFVLSHPSRGIIGKNLRLIGKMTPHESKVPTYETTSSWPSLFFWNLCKLRFMQSNIQLTAYFCMYVKIKLTMLSLFSS